jgi:hypothetical protein
LPFDQPFVNAGIDINQLACAVRGSFGEYIEDIKTVVH